LTRPYIMRVEPIDSGESGYRPPSREWIRRGRRGRNMFEEALKEETKEAPHGRPEQN